MAAQYGRTDVVKYLVSLGEDVNSIFNDESILYTAAYHGHAELCRFLIDTGADMRYANKGEF